MARLEASRCALILCLAPNPPRRRASTSGVDDSSSEKRSFVDTLKARIERNGLLQGGWQTARTLARRWWTRQSWHRSVDLVVETLVHEARPLMRRHPLATLATGAALGAGLVVAVSTVRPWVWHQIRGNGSFWGGRVGSLLWGQFSSAPVQMALAGALAAWVAEQGIRRSTHASAPSGGAAPHGDPADAAAPQSVKTPGTGSTEGAG